MNILLGLGNPGKQYVFTPHNVGYLFVESLAESAIWKKGKKNLFQKIIFNAKPILLAKPTTYMNLSGDAAQSLLSYYKLPLKQLIVIVDDVNLKLGSLRIREKGSDGGHNGLKNIIKHLGPEFIRIRVGIGYCPPEEDLSRFVLRKFNKDALLKIMNLCDQLPEIIDYGLKLGWQNAASKYNRSEGS